MLLKDSFVLGILILDTILFILSLFFNLCLLIKSREKINTAYLLAT